MSGRAGTVLNGVLHAMTQPANARRLRQVLVCLLALWGMLAVTRLLWALLPAGPVVAAPPKVLNPASTGRSSVAAAPVDIERMVGWHLFGEAGAVAPVPAVAVPDPVAEANSRAGIEKGAKQTRLQLKLAG